jgi:hypothetical protein
MTLGLTPRHGGLPGPAAAFCEGRVAPGSIYALLHRECFALLPDEMFADLFAGTGRGSVPPMIVAVVMVLQRLEGLSDREAADRFCFDVRWKYAAGGLDFDYPGFVHTVLADMRARLAGSARPGRIFEVTLEVGRAAGLIGRRRVLDSTPIYDAVATMDTVTLTRPAVRGLLAVAGDLTAELRGLLRRDDDYASAGKPACDYDDPAARQALVDALATDARALLAGLDGRELDPALAQAAALLASVTGQDLDQSADGVFRIARRVARDRIISTVDPQARHGHKTSARGFDGYKGHIAADPDAELITATAVTPASAGDAAAASGLLAEALPPGPGQAGPGPAPATGAPATATADDDPARPGPAEAGRTTVRQPAAGEDPPAVYGDTAYGTGELLDALERAGAEIYCKAQPPVASGGRFTKDAFSIDLAAGAVTCPAGHTAPLRPCGDGQIACFGPACATCPLAAQCTTAKDGRSIYAGPCERQLARARARQASPRWKAAYTATRPKAERKIGHLMRRRHGGRRARVRSRVKVAADFALLAAAVNLARLAVLEVTCHDGTWTAGGH